MSDIEHDLSEFVEGENGISVIRTKHCLLYTSDAADE